jgi:hypothetical protein
VSRLWAVAYPNLSCRVGTWIAFGQLGLYVVAKGRPTRGLLSYQKFFKRKKSIFLRSTFIEVRFSSLNFKTGQTISLNFLNCVFYLPRAVLKAVLLP